MLRDNKQPSTAKIGPIPLKYHISHRTRHLDRFSQHLFFFAEEQEKRRMTVIIALHGKPTTSFMSTSRVCGCVWACGDVSEPRCCVAWMSSSSARESLRGVRCACELPRRGHVGTHR